MRCDWCNPSLTDTDTDRSCVDTRRKLVTRAHVQSYVWNIRADSVDSPVEKLAHPDGIVASPRVHREPSRMKHVDETLSHTADPRMERAVTGAREIVRERFLVGNIDDCCEPRRRHLGNVSTDRFDRLSPKR